jgi:hypothetical protein
LVTEDVFLRWGDLNGREAVWPEEVFAFLGDVGPAPFKEVDEDGAGEVVDWGFDGLGWVGNGRCLRYVYLIAFG